MKYKRKIGWMILAGLVFGSILVLVTMYLWNWLVPALFGGPEMTFLQTLGLLILSKILFGFGKGGWKSKSHNRYSSHLSPEEKQKLRQKFMERCGWSDQKTPQEEVNKEGTASSE